LKCSPARFFADRSIKLARRDKPDIQGKKRSIGMQTHLSHILVNIRLENLAFYRNLMGFLGWKTLYEGDGMLGVRGTGEESIWFGSQTKEVTNDYDGPGMNHIGIGTATQADVDAVVSYLRDQKVQPLFETPRHRPDFAESEDHTYYQVMFESPDRILFEVVYIGPKQG
jgi:catechol 2,3-dioxygenase-like lactoylglutathione lyase family enzyme